MRPLWRKGPDQAMTYFDNLPPVRFDHLIAITDDVGIFQHCLGRVPAREHGYTSDDASRALIVVLNEMERRPFPEGKRLAVIYLSFLLHAQRFDGWFRNCLSFDRKWLDEGGSEDCYGRCLWALARCVSSPALDSNLKFAAEEMLKDALPWARRLRSLRGRALSVIGLSLLCREGWGDREEVEGALLDLAESLVEDLKAHSSSDWRWFEDILTYANARPVQALYAAYRATGRRKFLKAAEEAGDFLWEVTFDGEVFVPIGNRGWYPKGGRRALWAQQSIEAGSTVEAEVEAFEATGDVGHLEKAKRALDWFTGRNMLGEPLYEPGTGACHDGLEPHEVNRNCGAEATISCLAALQAMARAITASLHRAPLPAF